MLSQLILSNVVKGVEIAMPISILVISLYIGIEACLLKQLQSVKYSGVLLNVSSEAIAKDEYQVKQALNRVIWEPIELCHLVFSGDPREH
jgi:hypothetical protein